MLIFSLPLCMNSVAYWFLTSYNRVAISNVLSVSENGLYSIAGRFSSFITLFTTCFNEFAQVGDLHDGVGILQFFDYLVHYFASLS